MIGMYRQVVRELKADRRKLVMIVSLLLVGMFFWGRLLLKDRPKSASARSSPVAVAAPNSASAGKVASIASNAAGGPAESVVRVKLPTRLTRDYFSTGSREKSYVNPKYQARTTDEPSRSTSTTGVAGLKLETVLLGPRPRVVINDTLLGLGQQIQGYTVIQIAHRQVWVQANGTVFRLDM